MSTNEHQQAALSHLRVLDLSQGICGPYCTKLLAGFGAEVVKIEPPEGDYLRRRGPFAGKKPEVENSLPFAWFNTGKKSLVLDLHNKPDDVSEFKRMVAQADVVIEDLGPGPGGMAKLGLDYMTLSQINPRLVMTSISNFGQLGPYKDYAAEEITLYAMSALMNSTGDDAREPLCGGPAISQQSAGMKAYIATLMAVFRTRQSGIGDWVDLSIQEAALDNFEIGMAEYLHTGKVGIRRNDEHALVPWRIFPCRDGYAAIMGGPIRNWLNAAKVFEEPKLFEKKYEHMAGRMEHRDDIRELMKPWLMKNNKKDIYHIGQEKGMAWGYLATLQDVLESPQNKARGAFVDVDHPDIGRQSMVGAPFLPASTPWQQTRAPRLGEHSDDVRSAWRANAGSGAAIESAAQSAEVSSQPLAGLRIVDLTHDWAGPHAARIMADYGAEVIKVEYHPRLDGMRGAYADRFNSHPRWWEINRNKGSVSLNLHDAQQLEALKQLVAVSDILVENSRPGVLERLGLGYDVLKAIKPDLVVVCMSAYGSTGPESRYAGYGGAIEALSGVQSLTAYDRDGDPMRVRELDVTNGIMGACAMMTALLHHQRTGEGQFVDVSERESSTWMIGEHLLEYVANNEQTLPLGNRSADFAPQGCYRCEGDDNWLVITVRSDEEWTTLCDACGFTEAKSDSRFATLDGRREHHDEIDRLIEGWSAKRQKHAAMRQLQTAGIAAGIVADARDIAADEHLMAREWFQFDHANGGGRYPGFPFRLARGGGKFVKRGPDLDVDNEAVLCNLLKMPRSILTDIENDELGTAYDLE